MFHLRFSGAGSFMSDLATSSTSSRTWRERRPFRVFSQAQREYQPRKFHGGCPPLLRRSTVPEQRRHEPSELCVVEQLLVKRGPAVAHERCDREATREETLDERVVLGREPEKSNQCPRPSGQR